MVAAVLDIHYFYIGYKHQADLEWLLILDNRAIFQSNQTKHSHCGAPRSTFCLSLFAGLSVVNFTKYMLHTFQTILLNINCLSQYICLTFSYPIYFGNDIHVSQLCIELTFSDNIWLQGILQNIIFNNITVWIHYNE